ncbi:phosphatase PAP2 family protein [Halomonas halocynthiae]|uniref:phosphatase PAP2 family protein n=1 Tax=Halomonas halocynthiae TaxID=176290 RepID=UPI000426572C|nr:phosphatase PAP2 family protein [Halomonas halocynthiae]
MSLRRPLLLNALGLAIIFSWAVPSFTLWDRVDDQIFWFFNHTLSADNPAWTTLLAAMNSRLFDPVVMGLMLALMGLGCQRDPKGGWPRWVGIGVTMVLTAGVTVVLVRLLVTHTHESPTLRYPDATRITELVSFSTKAISNSSFPGDHGIMAMIFTGFMLAFGDRLVRALSLVILVLAAAPRVVVGAHWFTDILVGSLAIVLLILPWVLCTPLAERCTRAVSGYILRATGKSTPRT